MADFNVEFAIDDKTFNLHESTVIVDDELSSSSTNPVQNKVIDGEITNLKLEIEQIGSGLSDEAKIALLACFENVAWANANGQTYYNTLVATLSSEIYPKITATFNSSATIVYTDDTLNSLKTNLIVKYFDTAQSSGVTLSSNDYTLSGILNDGDNVIVVTYGNLTTTFIVNAIDIYNKWVWDLSDAYATIENGGGGAATIDNVYVPVITQGTTPFKTRRTFCALHGIVPYIYNNGTSISRNVYPIPIPDGAVKMTVTLKTGQVFGGQILSYNNGTWTKITEYSSLSGWLATGTEVTLPDSYTNRYFCSNIALSNTSSNFPEGEPSSVHIVFT